MSQSPSPTIVGVMAITAKRQKVGRGQNTTMQLAVGVSGLCLVVMVLGTIYLFSSAERLPSAIAPPKMKSLAATVRHDRNRPAFYATLLGKDIRKLGLPGTTPAELGKGNPRRREFKGKKSVKAGQELQTESLQLVAEVRSLWVGGEGKGMKAEHLILRLTNKTTKHLAYRVLTRMGKKCRGHGFLRHNAIALEPGETIERAECILSRGTRIVITSVEVMDLAPVGYHYVSRLDPLRLGYVRRIAAAHKLGKLRQCKFFPWRIVERALQSKLVHWYDIIDFYSRHNCDEYSFYPDYRWQKAGQKKLPALAK